MEPNDGQGLDTARHVEQFEKHRLAPVVFLLLFATSLAALVYTVHEFLMDVLNGLILVGLFSRVQYRTERLCKGRRWVASFLVTTLVALSVLAPVGVLAVLMVREATSAYMMADASLKGGDGGLFAAFAHGVHDLLAELGISHDEAAIREQILQAVAAGRAWVFEHAGSLANNVVAVGMHFGVILLVVLYLLVEGDKLKAYVFKLSPLPDEEEELLLTTFRQVARGTLYSNGVTSIVQGVLCGAAMAVVGFSSPVLWGCVMAVFAFLPFVGASTVVIPASLYLYVAGERTSALLFFVFCSLVAFVMESIVKTKMLGAGARMHDLLVFLAVVGGISVFGLFGLILGPLIAASFMTLTELYLHSYRKRLANVYLGRQDPPSLKPAR